MEAGNTSFDARRLHSSGMRRKGKGVLFLLEIPKLNSAAPSLLHGLPVGKDQRWPEELQGLHRNAAPTEGSAQQRHTQSGQRVIREPFCINHEHLVFIGLVINIQV